MTIVTLLRQNGDGRDLRDELRGVVAEVLAEVLKTPAEIEDDANLVDHGLTSFESVTLVLSLEDRLGVAFPDDALVLHNFLTPARIVDLVERVTSAAVNS